MTSAGGPIVVMGAGAVGSYVGGMLSAAGEDVILVDGWSSHIEAIRADGLIVDTPERVITARPRALHISDVERLAHETPALAFLCVKLYDTDWAATLLGDIVRPAPVVTMQNALVEETVARIVGRGRTLGAIAGALDVSVVRPGLVRRSRRRGASAAVFKIGELSGETTPRVRSIADLLSKVDTTVVTSRLWDDRWTKLVANTMTSGLSAVAGLTLVEVYRRDDTRRIAIPLGAEAFAVGEKLGFERQAVFGVPSDRWQVASGGKADAIREVMEAMFAQTVNMVDGGQSGTLQDLSKGRRTEVDYFNGYIADCGRKYSVATPVHAALATLIRRMERGEDHPDATHLVKLR